MAITADFPSTAEGELLCEALGAGIHQNWMVWFLWLEQDITSSQPIFTKFLSMLKFQDVE